MAQKCDILILGAGVVGLATGIAILESSPTKKVTIAEKENTLGCHASGRNSGVIHAGFYYSPDSLKAKFCRDGNQNLRKLAKKYSIPIRDVGKVVVTRDESELSRLNTLFERGLLNGVDLEIFDQSKLSEFEPLATTHDKFLWSPTTAVSSPNEIISAMAQEFISLGGRIEFNQKISLALFGDEIHDATNAYDATHIINAAGAQADRISRSIGVGADYAMLPFMGVYSATEEMNLPLRRLVYPVPHPVNPFLGVHFTLTIDHKVKIGPTAIPIIGREQYSLLAGWSGSDIAQSLIGIKSLMLGDAHNFGAIIKTEWPKVFQKLLVRESLRLVPSASQVKNWSKKPPGIRAQLVHKPTGRLEQDFVVERKLNSTHVLNAVSPGWTSALPFGRYLSNIVEQYFD